MASIPLRLFQTLIRNRRRDEEKSGDCVQLIQQSDRAETTSNPNMSAACRWLTSFSRS
jgi:hypothetical protein